MDQSIVSLANFLTTIIVGRTLPQEEFGVFILFMTTIVFFQGISQSLVTGPTWVLGVNQKGDFFSAQTTIQRVLAILIVCVSFATIMIAFQAELYLGICFVFCYFLQDCLFFTRTVELTKFRHKRLLGRDVIAAGLRLGGLCFLAFYQLLSIETALLSIGISAFAAIAVFNISDKRVPATKEKLIRNVSENWHYGKWLLLETMAYTMSQQAYFYLTAAIIDVRSTAALGAAFSLVQAVNVILIGISNYATPNARKKLMEQGYDAWQNWLMQTGLVLFLSTAAFVVIISVFAVYLLEFLFSAHYGKYAYLVPIIGVSAVCNSINMVLIAAFRTSEQPQVGMLAKVISSMVTIVCGYPLLMVFGVGGAALGLVLSQLCWSAVIVYFVFIKGALSKATVLKAVNLMGSDG